jgi:hypothetical protein
LVCFGDGFFGFDSYLILVDINAIIVVYREKCEHEFDQDRSISMCFATIENVNISREAIKKLERK